jgi:hypothetical protein
MVQSKSRRVAKIMTNRWWKFLSCAVVALLLLACCWLMPAYWTAVDISVLQRAGANTPSLPERGLALLNNRNLGAAQMLLEVAQGERVPGWGKLGLTVTNVIREHPTWAVWGGGDSHSEGLFDSDPSLPKSGSEPFTEFVIRQENREVILAYLQESQHPAVQELLRCRELTNTVIFPPSHSASGQAFDTAVSICGLLMERGYLTPALTDQVFKLASAANHGGSSQPVETVLMDLLSLGQRLNWDQLVVFAHNIQDAGTLHQLADQIRKANDPLPVLFAGAVMSGKPAETANYLAKFSQTGMKNLATSLRFGAGGVRELLERDQRLYSSGLRQRVAEYNPFGAIFYLAVNCGYRLPGSVLAAKWTFYLLAGFLLALALHFARPDVSSLERPLQVRGFHVIREILFALGFLLVVILLSEPFLAQENQKEAFSFRLHVPTTGSTAPAEFARAHPTFMNNVVLLTLLLFFVLQGLIYLSCLAKLKEIRRQKVPPRMKLKLLENEDHLFDAGLYLGFVGTIVSLILVSIGLIKFSLMAAYSSTSFGIVFVCLFKIFHLRPARRKLLLEAETKTEAPTDIGAVPATSS